MIYISNISNLDGSGEQRLTEGAGPALSPDQRYVAFTRSGSLYLFDLETMEEKTLLDRGDGRAIVYPIWHPDGDTIFFLRETVFDSDIYAIQKDGTNPRLVVKGGGWYEHLFWPGPLSPDGGHLLYTDCHDDCAGLLVLDLETGNRVSLSDQAGYGA